MIILSSKKIKTPNNLDSLSASQFSELKRVEVLDALNFIIPEHCRDNKDKRIYKTGFLFLLLSNLYVDKTQDEICEMLTNRYHVFLDKRQILRYSSLFESIYLNQN